ncbi:MAG: APC family permease [Candidatus Micrarchaeia archaeon]
MFKLKRSLSLLDAVMINLGAIIGAGIFVIIGIAIGDAGPAVVISILLGGVIATFTGISFAEISMKISKEGGVYEYAREILSPFAGFLGGLIWSFGNIIALAAISMSMGSYVNELFDMHLPIMYFAVIDILTFMALNIVSIKHSAKSLTALVITNIAILVIFVIAGMFAFKPSNFSDFAPNGFSGILSGTAVIFFAFTGFSRITTVGDEVKDPKRTIPKAIIISIIISTLLYILVAVTAIGLVPARALASSASPLAVAIKVMHYKFLTILIAIGGITATAGVTLTGILGVSRLFYAMGRDNVINKKMSYVDKFSTPVYSIILTSLLALVFVFTVSFNNIVEASNAAILVAYGMINLSAYIISLKIKKSGKSEKGLLGNKYFRIIPILGLLSIGTIIYYLGIESLLIVFGISAFATFYYFERDAHITSIPKHSSVRLFGKSRYLTKTR